jgi:hypothetical protein
MSATSTADTGFDRFFNGTLGCPTPNPSGYVAEPTSFLLHVLDATGCVTYSVASSHAAAFITF